MAKESSAIEAWQHLPSGGKLFVGDGFRIVVTDEGKSHLDEWTILKESAQVLNAKLEYAAAASRAKRWKHASWWEVFIKPKEMWRWNTADVLRSACERCGENAGAVWWPLPASERGWVCGDCHAKLNKGEPWDH